MINQYTQYPVTEKKSSKNLIFLVLIVAVFIIILASLFFLFTKKNCGNNTCDSEESCSSCPEDCGSCPPVCGDAVCEYGEDEWNCCDDCTCNVAAMACNITTHSCGIPSIELTDDEAISIFKQHLILKGFNSSYVNSKEYEVNSSTYQGEPTKTVCEKRLSEIQTVSCGVIAQNKTVVYELSKR